jgi:hypothetical protein
MSFPRWRDSCPDNTLSNNICPQILEQCHLTFTFNLDVFEANLVQIRLRLGLRYATVG